MKYNLEEFLGLTLILESKKILISDISDDIMCMMLVESDYQILVTEICNGGRISYILSNCSKHQ